MIAHAFREKSLYIVLMSLASLLGFSKVLIFSKILSVQEFGIYSLVLSSYIFYVFLGGFGLQEGLLKKGSMSLVTNDPNIAKGFLASGIIASMIFGGVIAVLIILFSNLDIEIIDDDKAIQTFYLGFLLALATIFFELLDSFLRSQQKFIFYSFILVLKNLTAIILGIFLAKDFGARGLVFAEFFSVLCIFSISLLALLDVKDFSRAEVKIAKKLISNGWRMMFTKVIRNIALMADRWFIIFAVGATALGYYAFTMILLTISMVLVGFLVTIKGPVWIATFKINENVKDLVDSINRCVFPICLLLILFSPAIWFFTDDVLLLFYPKYAIGAVYELTFIIYISLIAVVPIYLYDWAFVATSKEGTLFNLSLFGSLIAVLFYIIAWWMNADIVGFALMFLAARTIMLCIYFYRLRIMYVY